MTLLPVRLIQAATASTSTITNLGLVARRVLAPLAIGASLVVVLTGCGGGSSNSPSIQAGGSTAAVSSTPAASPPAAASSTTVAMPSSAASDVAATPPSSARPSVPALISSHADPALEAMLPAEVSGTAMQRSSATLASLLDSGGDRTAVDAFLRGLGKSEDDGSFAVAFDPTNIVGGGIYAFKIAGVNSDVLLPAIVSVEQSDLGTGATTKQATVGGKSVTVVSVGDDVNDTEWVYGRGEVVFVVHAADEAHAATFIQALS